MQSQTVVVVSVDSSTCDSIRNLLESVGLQTETFSSLRAFLSVGIGGASIDRWRGVNIKTLASQSIARYVRLSNAFSWFEFPTIATA